MGDLFVVNAFNRTFASCDALQRMKFYKSNIECFKKINSSIEEEINKLDKQIHLNEFLQLVTLKNNNEEINKFVGDQ
jgi:hypothetical protein